MSVEFSSKVFAVVLAGGSGTRFWPRSRQAQPKQLCKITDPNESMIEQTLHRLDGCVPPERRMIVTHHTQEKQTRGLSKGLCDHYLIEPSAKNTAAALALACLQIRLLTHDDPETIMLSLHADHLIKNRSAFQKTLASAVHVARESFLTLVGVPPLTPETGFGYIEKGESLKIPQVSESFRVKSFKEKPDLKTAKQYVEAKTFLWNTGIFVWKLQTLSQAFETLLPDLWSPLFQSYETLKGQKKTFADLSLDEVRKLYEPLPEIPIDNGILEKSSHCALVTAEFDWNDVGSWTSLTDIFPMDQERNLLQGTVLSLKNKDSILLSDGPMLAAYGVDNLIVVVENGCVLVCPKNQAQGVKELVSKLKDLGRKDLI